MAEGIKISEMEQVTTLKDGCCFPIVSDGENKKITKKDLYSLMTTDLQNQINKTNSKFFESPKGQVKYITISSKEIFGGVEVNIPYAGKWIFATPFTPPFYFCNNEPYKKYGLSGYCWSSDGKKLYLKFGGQKPVAISCLGSTKTDVVISDWSNTSPNVTWETSLFDIANLQNQINSNKTDLQNQITNTTNNLQNQITSNDNDIASLQKQITSNDNDIASLQSQINTIKKPDGIEIFRMGINESTSSWESYTTTENGITYYWKTKSFKVNGTVINTCITQGYARENIIPNNVNPNGYKYNSDTIIIDINLGNSNQDVICKGYIEYV